MPVRFYLGYVSVLLMMVVGVELIFGTLYARYVIIYTGAIFMVGLLAGQRYEQAWIARQRSLADARAGTRPQHASTSTAEMGQRIGGAS